MDQNVLEMMTKARESGMQHFPQYDAVISPSPMAPMSATQVAIEEREIALVQQMVSETEPSDA